MTAPVVMPTVLLRNAALPAALAARPDRLGGRRAADLLTGDLLLERGVVRGFVDPDEAPAACPELDLGGRILLPRLVEPHGHLDKCHTIARLETVGGDLPLTGIATSMNT